MIYPEFPVAGDVIGICAPSAGIGGKADSFRASLEALNAAGYNTYTSDSVWNDACPSASAEIRGAEFNQIWADDDISMVMSASGGDYNVEMLPYIDQDMLTSVPKWFAGYSDPTAVEMLLTTKLDIASIYGVNAGAWDLRPLLEYQETALRLISGEIPVQRSYEYWAGSGFDEESGTYIMDTPVSWDLFVPSDGELILAQELDVTGRLIGGCIDVIEWLTGTPYEDLKGFADRYKEDGFIWFFDNFELNPMNLMYAMNKLRLMGLFDNARAVIIGRTCFPGDASDLDYLIQLERVFRYTDVPLIWNADIGHTKPSFTLINGSIGRLVMKDGAAELTMELR